MTEDLKRYESSIKKKHSFAWTPNYQEEFQTQLNPVVFIPIAIKTMEKLEWEVIYEDQNTVEAKRKGPWSRKTEKITVTNDYGKVVVKSVSLGNELWDMGRNSKRVRLFIYAFKLTENEFDKETLAQLEEETEKANNWDDYEIPETLPQPKKRRVPQFWIPILGGVLTSLLLGFVVAFLTIKFTYVIGIFEVGVALVIGLALKYLIRLSNYTNYNYLNYLVIGMTTLVYVSNQYFSYEILLSEFEYQRLGFFEFIQLRFEAGLTIKSLDTGWIGLVISWIFQLVFTYIIASIRLTSSLISYSLERVPMEVVNFAVYHFFKEKDEDEVREELSKMGWSNTYDQDEVFASIGAMYDATELNRM